MGPAGAWRRDGRGPRFRSGVLLEPLAAGRAALHPSRPGQGLHPASPTPGPALALRLKVMSVCLRQCPPHPRSSRVEFLASVPLFPQGMQRVWIRGREGVRGAGQWGGGGVSWLARPLTPCLSWLWDRSAGPGPGRLTAVGLGRKSCTFRAPTSGGQ